MIASFLKALDYSSRSKHQHCLDRFDSFWFSTPDFFSCFLGTVQSDQPYLVSLLPSFFSSCLSLGQDPSFCQSFRFLLFLLWSGVYNLTSYDDFRRFLSTSLETFFNRFEWDNSLFTVLSITLSNIQYWCPISGALQSEMSSLYCYYSEVPWSGVVVPF